MMKDTLDPAFAAALRRELVALPTEQSRNQTPARRRTRRLAVLVSAAAGLTGAIGGVAALAGSRPAGEVAAAPLAAPLIVNGTGPASVALPAAPYGAHYLRLELACFDGRRCATPGGSVSDFQGSAAVQRDALPLTDQTDKNNAQVLPRFDPARGLPVDVELGTRWRLYVVYADSLNPRTARADNGKILGIPGNEPPPNLVPAVTTEGRKGWIDYVQLTLGGPDQTDLPVYDDEGVKIIGTADVGAHHR